MENKKAVLYARVSSDRQEKDGFSIPAQIKFLREYADKCGLSIVKEFTEAETAKKAGRTEFNNMLKFFKENPDVKNLLVEKTDRAYRNFKDYVVLEEYDLAVHLVKENQVLSKESRSHDKFIHGIKVLMAKNYIDNLSEEVKKAKLEKAEQGEYSGPAPFGYKNNLKDHIIEIDENQAKVVKLMFELYSSRLYTLFTLRKKILKDGLSTYFRSKNVPKATLARILQSPIYYGMIPHQGKLYKGIHEPIISKKLFDEVQEILHGKATSKGSPRKSFIYSGLMICGNCGCSITAELKKGKYTYYHCTNGKGNCSKKSVNEKELDHFFVEALKNLAIDKEKLEWIKEGLRDSHNEEKKMREETILGLENELRTVRERLDKLHLDKIDGKITEDFWSRTSDSWLKRQHELTSTIEQHKNANVEYLNQGIALLDKASSLYEEYKLKKEIEEKRKLLNIVLSNSVLSGSNLVVNYNEPFFIFAEMSKSREWRGIIDEVRTRIRDHKGHVYIPDLSIAV